MKSLGTRALVVGVAGLALALSGCASGSIDGGSTPEETASGELTHVTYGLFPSSTVAALQVAIDEGIFEEHGIDLELVVGAGSSAAQLPALTSGELDFMLASPVTALTASAQGLDVRIVTGVTQNDPETVEDSTAVVVGAGSSIESAKDLAGKTVSVNALGSVGEIGIREAVELDGGDPSTINFVQLSFPEVAAQLEAGQIDAGMAGSPFMQQVIGAGGRVVSDFIQETGLGANELVTIASGQLVDSDPELVAQFSEAMTAALSFLHDNNDLVRAAMPEVLGTDPAAADRAKLSIYDAGLDNDTIQLFADLLFKYKIVETEPDVAAIVWQP
ncbi:ABC transporter substrate-binding protein [Leifsonia sp. H3M29-4]|uniref:ABC transporter substrate-binding protein n=1 Tax=Salinibacterium metalliresistens TaxID=3031321 RepID=UPI0023DBBFA8|nr:ABC transporter substrate-binding protein [Salinibacterium metalliresistens]MDF1477688.1 ABC transporter substrate-binding protein [Salinibacterium metalliresistens]